MGIYYDPAKSLGNRWVVSYEKTDYTPEELKTDRPTNLTKTIQETYWTEECALSVWPFGCVRYRDVQKTRDKTVNDDAANAVNAQLNADGIANQDQLQINKFKNQAYDKTIAIANTSQGGDYTKQRQLIRSFFDIKDSLLPTNLPTGRAVYTPLPTDNYMEVDAPYDPENPPYARNENGEIIYDCDPDGCRPRIQPERMSVPNEDLNNQNAAYNNYYESISQQNAQQNVRNKKINEQKLQANPTLSLQQALEDQFKTFYRTEKLQQWDPALGAKPQYGDFDPAYYKAQNPTVAKQWADAVANDDIDITERYGENGYYLQHYTTQGKAAGLRGNAPEATEAATAYMEPTPTDADLQNVRDLQLNVDTKTQVDRLLAIPEIAAEWEKAKQADPYWKALAKANYLDVEKPDEFVTLFRLSDRPEDKQVSLNYNINVGYGITELEDALNEAVGTKAAVDVKKFGALAQDVLKQTIEEMKKAKAKESMLSLLGGFGGFSEIVNINKELSSSILGDSGVGGILSFTSKKNPEESLERSLQKVTGINNIATYNWQQWFDGQLKQRYQQDLELGLTQDQAAQKVAIEGEFARNFIDKYLIPRFNTSRSMDEFVEYLDVRQEEQNPFQTQDLLNATQMVANLRAQQYLDQLKATSDRYFNADFYFNPTGDKAREANYLEQATTVAKDWADAKAGDPYWQQQAYRFGVDINDKAAFARMHFQVKGQGKGYDAADDILNASKVTDQIYNNILPALKQEALKQGTVFGVFTTPEEFADEMLKGLDPNDQEQWNEVLKRYGLTDFKGSIDELKQYIIETLRTGSAQRIREEIKFLNERRQTPTQEKLGITYIERPEDAKTIATGSETELYKVFQNAGYQGTEDEFYKTMFPDVDRTEQQLLTKAGTGSGLAFKPLDLKDPFASLGTIQSFFDDTDQTDTTAEAPGDASSYFRMGLDSQDETQYKSPTAEKILGEFTSMFKGF